MSKLVDRKAKYSKRSYRVKRAEKWKLVSLTAFLTLVFVVGFFAFPGGSSRAEGEDETQIGTLTIKDQFNNVIKSGDRIDMETKYLFLTVYEDDKSIGGFPTKTQAPAPTSAPSGTEEPTAAPTGSGSGTTAEPVSPASLYALSLADIQSASSGSRAVSDYTIDWEILLEEQRGRVSLNPYGDGPCTVTAQAPGEVLIDVTVTKKGGMTTHFVFTLNVRLAINTVRDDDPRKYQLVKKTDKKESLILPQDGKEHQVELTFGKPTDAVWWTDSDEVVEIGLDTGIVKAVGAGQTRIHARYTNESGEAFEAYIDVFVLPRVSDTDGDDFTQFRTSMSMSLKTGDYIYTNTDFSSEIIPMRNKLFWTVTQEQNGKIVTLADANKNDHPEIIRVAPAESYGNRLQVYGVAGKYYINLYTYGTYDEKADDKNKLTNITLDGGGFPVTINLTIRSSIEDTEKNLNIGDSYNFAEAYNLSAANFIEYFEIPSFQVAEAEPVSGSGSIIPGGNYAEYFDYNKDTAVGRSKKEGTITARIKVRDNKREQVEALLGGKPLPLDMTYTTLLRMQDRMQLSSSSLVISVGQEHQLSAIMGSTYSEQVTWESSDPKSVSVDETGLIKGLRETKTNDVIITAKLGTGNGVYRTATCTVKVEAAVSNFTLDPSKEKFLTVKDTLSVKANIKQTVSIAPLKWLSSDTKVFTVAASADAKSAVVTAVGGGSADLMVYNPANDSMQVLRITVRVPITQMKFSKETMAFQMYTKGYNLWSDLSYKPSNITSTEYVWSSSDTSVATVDKQGQLTFKKPGTTLITVYPEYNPENVMASCTVTISGSPGTMLLSATEVVMNVKEKTDIKVVFSPSTATSTLKWTPNDTKIVKVAYDDSTKTATLTASKVGSTSINVVSAEGLISTVDVTVRQPATDVSIKEKDVVLLTGEKITLTPVLKPTDSTDTLKWDTEDKKIATVDQNGTVTGVKPGDTFIYVTAYNGSKQECFGRVAVSVRDKVSGISIPKPEYSVMEGETVRISPKIEPDSAYNKKVKWTVSNKKLAELVAVEGNDIDILVKGLLPGSVLVTCETEDGGYSASCMVLISQIPTPTPTPTMAPTPTMTPTASPTQSPTLTPAVSENPYPSGSGQPGASDASGTPSVAPTLTPAVTSSPTPTQAPTAAPTKDPALDVASTKVKVSPSTKILRIGKSFFAKATVTGAVNKKVKWTTSNKKICTVTQSGKVKGKKVGTAYITATSQNGSGVKARCKVRVIRLIKKISLLPSTDKILVGELLRMKAVIKNKKATYKKLKWSSADSGVATVDANGKVLGIAPGIVQIKVKAKDGSGKTARSYITVKEVVEATGVTVENSSITIPKGKGAQSGIKASPANTTMSIRYYSDNPRVASVNTRGKISTHHVGDATIYGETSNGKVGSCDVTVVDLNRKGIEMRQYDSEQLRVNDVSEGVTWYSKNTQVATIDEDGLVTGRKKGVTIVYANVNGVKLGCRVKVNKL